MFRPDPAGIKQLAREGEMRRYMGQIGAATAREVDGRKPNLRGGKAIKVSHEEQMGPDGWETEVRYDGFLWGIMEFGSVKSAAKPALRPGVQAALARFDGRFRGD